METHKAYVYAISNLLSGKTYIGMTSDPARRWKKHITVAKCGSQRDSYYIHRAMRKHGVKNFSFNVVEEYGTQKECDDGERFFIAYLRAMGAQLYNLTDGGEGAFGRKLSEETKAKISASHIGLKHTENTKKLLVQENIKRFSDPKYKAKIVSMLVANAKDERKKKRGSQNIHSKLNEEKVINIRDMFASGKFSKTTLGKMFGVCRKNITAIVTKQTWTHI